MENIVKNASKGYGYNYASLSDIAKQGYTIPKMKTGTEEGREYVFYKDGDEWIRGSEIVIPESKSMNKAQLYGSALTYARRYTTLMALQLSCDDDAKVEDLKADGTRKTKEEDAKISNDQWKSLNSFYTKDEIKAMYEELGITNGKDIPMDYAVKKIEEYWAKSKKELPDKEYF